MLEAQGIIFFTGWDASPGPTNSENNTCHLRVHNDRCRTAFGAHFLTPGSSYNRLGSRLDRGEYHITIFTQCSLSRLWCLERMCSLWTGVISAAVIAEGGGRIDRNMRRKVATLHARVESRGKCRLDISLCEPAPGVAADDGLYPVNALRNIALKAATTDLVLSLVSSTRISAAAPYSSVPCLGFFCRISSRPSLFLL